MKRDRFLRIVREIKNGEVDKKRDRENFLKLEKEYVLREDKDYFLFFDGKKVKYLNEKLFEEFIEDYLKSFIEKNLSKKEAIEKNQNSKKGSLHTSENIIVYRKRQKKAEIFFNQFPVIKNRVVVIENFESFLKVDFELFEEEDFIYLGGFGKRIVREFLKNKEVLFFVDFDFFGIEIYNSIECKSKQFFIPKNLKNILIEKGSNELYKKQLFLKERLKIDNNTKEVFELINRYSKCLEQEIFDVN